MKRGHETARGDVLMEYVLLMVCIVVPLVCGSRFLYNAGGGTQGVTASAALALEKEDDFGIVGNNLVQMFRRTFMGLALPIP